MNQCGRTEFRPKIIRARLRAGRRRGEDVRMVAELMLQHTYIGIFLAERKPAINPVSARYKADINKDAQNNWHF